MNDVTSDVIAGVALPTFKLVKVPKLVIFGWAGVAIVPVKAVDVTFVKPVPVVPSSVIPPTDMNDAPLNALPVIFISLPTAT